MGDGPEKEALLLELAGEAAALDEEEAQLYLQQYEEFRRSIRERRGPALKRGKGKGTIRQRIDPWQSGIDPWQSEAKPSVQHPGSDTGLGVGFQSSQEAAIHILDCTQGENPHVPATRILSTAPLTSVALAPLPGNSQGVCRRLRQNPCRCPPLR